MGDIKEQLNNIKFETIFNLLGIKTFPKGMQGTRGIWEDNKKTDGWTLNVNDNYVTDFSGKRAQGDVIRFLETYLNMTFQEVLEWGKDKFNLKEDKGFYKPTKQQMQPERIIPKANPTIKQKFDNLPECNQKQIDYIESRGIKYKNIKELVKDSNGLIAVGIYNEKGQFITYNSRSIVGKDFRIPGGTQSDGVYMGKIDSTIKKVFVVEGMFDFLTLAQYTTNVIGLKSATEGTEVIKTMEDKGYKIIITPDNDPVGEKPLEKLEDIRYWKFDLSNFGVKDINDYHKDFELGESILNILEEDSVKKREDFDIVEYGELLDEGVEELLNTNPEYRMSWGYQDQDDKLGYIMPGQLIIVGGITGTGKSSKVNDIAQNVSAQGLYVGRFTLEDRYQDIRKKEMYFEIGRIRKKQGLKNYPINEYMVNNIKTKKTLLKEIQEAKQNLKEKNKRILEVQRNSDEQININILEKLVKEFIKRDCKLIILDHLQEFKIEGNQDRHDLKLEEMMYKIKAIARNYNVAIILIAHYKKVGDKKPNDESFKDSIAITQVANKVIHLYRDKLEESGVTEMIITKNRDNPGGTGVLEFMYDVETAEYRGVKSKTQKSKEKKLLNLNG